MSGVKIGLIVAVLVVVVAGGWWFVSQGDSNQIDNGNLPTETKSDKKMAFADFIKQGGSYKCTVSQSIEGTETSGVTYIHDGMIRSEYNTQVQGLDVDTYMIVRDGYSYTWSSMMPGAGFKVGLSDASSSNSAAASGSYSFDAEKIGEYDCNPWKVDKTMFDLPSDISFREI